MLRKCLANGIRIKWLPLSVFVFFSKKQITRARIKISTNEIFLFFLVSLLGSEQFYTVQLRLNVILVFLLVRAVL